MSEQAERIYSDRKGKSSSEPFPGWIYYTEYKWGPEGMELGTGLNPQLADPDKRTLLQGAA
jgi:hypothetical protein